MLDKALRVYGVLSFCSTAWFLIYALRGGDPSTCAHPSIRTDLPGVEW